MKKWDYTHVQMLLPEIEAIIGEGKTQREVAEHFGFKDKYVVKRLLKRPRAYPAQNWRGAACAAHLRLKLDISYQGDFFGPVCTI